MPFRTSPSPPSRLRRRRSTCSRAAALVAGLLIAATLAPATATAQGSIRGCARDQHDGVLPGVEIIASGPDGTAKAVTDISGCYQLPNIKAGTYSVIARLAGFTTARREAIAVADGRTTESVDFGLCLAALEEIDWALPAGGPAGLWKQSDVVARIRIVQTRAVRTECPGTNDFEHMADVEEVFKGDRSRRLDRTLTFAQENWSGERTPYAIGQDMIVFLAPSAGVLRRTAGPHSVFLLKAGQVINLGAFAETNGMTAADFLAKLRALAKEPEGR